MPHPSILDRDTLIITAHTMIETDGVAKFSLHKLAARFDVKTSSLYRYFRNKDALLREVNLRTSQQLFAALSDAFDNTGTVEAQLLRVAQGYRAFALAHPVVYTLIFSSVSDALRPDEATLEAGAVVWQQMIAELTGDDRALMALRGMWALMHGFITLELSGQFRRGGNLEQTYTDAIYIYLTGCMTAKTDNG